MGEAAFAAWGWRIPFLLSVVLIGVALYIQLRLEDTPVFRQLEERQQEGEETESRSPVLEVLRYHPKQVLLAGRVLRRQRRLLRNDHRHARLRYEGPWGVPEPHAGGRPDLQFRPDLLSNGLVRALGPPRTPSRVLGGRGAVGALGFPHVLAREHQNRVPDHPRALYRADVPEHDVRSAGRALLRDVQRAGALLGGFDRLPGRVCLCGGLAPIIMVWLLETTGTSLSVSLYVFAMAVVTFVSVYLITETYEDEMTRDQVRETEEEAATTG